MNTRTDAGTDAGTGMGMGNAGTGTGMGNTGTGTGMSMSMSMSMTSFLDRFSDEMFRPVVYEPLPSRLVRIRVALSAVKYSFFAAALAALTASNLSIPVRETLTVASPAEGGGWECRGKGTASGAFEAVVPLQADGDCAQPFDIESLDGDGAEGRPSGCFLCTITYAFQWAGEDDCRRRLDMSRVPGTDRESSIPFTSELSFRDGGAATFDIALRLTDFPWLSASCSIPVVLPENIRRAIRADARGKSHLVALQEFATGECFDRRGGPSVCGDGDGDGAEDLTGRLKVFVLRAWDDVDMRWAFDEKVMQAPSAIGPAFMREIDPRFAETNPLDFGARCAAIPPPPPFECSRLSRKGVLEAGSIAFGGASFAAGGLSYILSLVWARAEGRRARGPEGG